MNKYIVIGLVAIVVLAAAMRSQTLRDLIVPGLPALPA